MFENMTVGVFYQTVLAGIAAGVAITTQSVTSGLVAFLLFSVGYIIETTEQSEKQVEA